MVGSGNWVLALKVVWKCLIAGKENDMLERLQDCGRTNGPCRWERVILPSQEMVVGVLLKK